jgi:hypothetical protein
VARTLPGCAVLGSLVAVSPIALATAPTLVWLAGVLDVSVSFFVYSRDGCYELFDRLKVQRPQSSG